MNKRQFVASILASGSISDKGDMRSDGFRPESSIFFAKDLVALSKIAPSADPSIVNGIIYYWRLGNYIGRADGVSVVKSERLPIDQGAWVAVDGVRSVGSFRRNLDTDDTLAVARAFDWAMSCRGMVVADQSTLAVSSPLPTIVAPMTFAGWGALKTVLKVSPSLQCAPGQGVITTRDVWMGGATAPWRQLDPTVAFADQHSGVSLVGFSIIGTREAAVLQNGIIHSDSADNLHLDDLKILNLKGCGWGCYDGPRANAQIRESYIGNIYTRRCGWDRRSVPGVRLYSSGSGDQDASNQITIVKLDAIWPDGVGVEVRGSHRKKSIRYLNILSGMIHGNDKDEVSEKPLMSISGGVYSSTFSNIEFNGLRRGRWAIDISGEADELKPARLDFSGSIGSGGNPANGISISAGEALRFDMRDVNVVGTGLMVGERVAGPIIFRSADIRPDFKVDIAPGRERAVRIDAAISTGDLNGAIIDLAPAGKQLNFSSSTYQLIDKDISIDIRVDLPNVPFPGRNRYLFSRMHSSAGVGDFQVDRLCKLKSGQWCEVVFVPDLHRWILFRSGEQLPVAEI